MNEIHDFWSLIHDFRCRYENQLLYFSARHFIRIPKSFTWKMFPTTKSYAGT